MDFDDVEHLLEGVLAGLKARKEIEPLRKKNSELEGKITALIDDKKILTQQVDELAEKFDAAQKDFNQREEELRGQLDRQRDDFNHQLDAAQKDFNQREEELRGQLDAANKKFFAADKAREIAERTAKFYRDTYSELDAAYKIYLTLDEATRFDLAGIFGAGDTATGFFSGAVQQEHLAPFWDYVSRHSDDENLSRLFDFCFEMVNRGFREPPFVRLTVATGNYFDTDIMRRTSQSRQRGEVVRVILQGYSYSGGNVIKKSVVELG